MRIKKQSETYRTRRNILLMLLQCLVKFRSISTSYKVEKEKAAKGNTPLSPCVGMTRLELATTRPPDAYANQLRHIPIDSKIECKDNKKSSVVQTIHCFFC